eukprot:307642_1
MSLLTTPDFVKATCEACVSFINVSLLIVTIFRIRNMDKNEIRKSKRIITVIITIFTCFAFCFALNPCRLFLYGSNQLYNTVSIILWSTAALFGLIGALSIYIFMAVQLHTIFHETQLKVNKRVSTMHCIIFIAVIFLLCSRILFQVITDHRAQLFNNISGILSILLLSFGVFHMVWLFNKKLYFMTVSQKKHLETLSKNNTDINISKELVLLQIIVKVTVLITYNVVSTVFVIVIGTVFTIIGGNVSISIFWIIWAFWAIVASLNIFLIISVNNTIYLFLCGICHGLFRYLCEYLASTASTKETSKAKSVIKNTKTKKTEVKDETADTSI